MPELLDGDDQAARRTDLGDLLDRHERHQRGGAEAAVLLVVEDAEDPVLAEELDDVPRKLGRLVDLGRARRDALARELADQLADLLLLLGQRLGRHARNPRASLLVSAPWRSGLPSLSPFSASSGRPWRSRTSGDRDYGWELTPTRRRGRPTPRPVGRQRADRLGERQQSGSPRGKVLRTTNRGRVVALRRASRHSCAPVPGHRGVQPPTGPDHLDRQPPDGLADLPHDERRPHMDARLPESRAARVLRLHGVLRQAPGLALSDPVNGRFRILATDDGGRSWQVVDADMPPALPGEFAFAASGQCSSHGASRRRRTAIP